MPAVKKTKESSPKLSYKDLITEGLKALNSGKGASRVALKKYVKDNHPDVSSASLFDSYFNNAIKKGVETKDFQFPKGPSGVLKLVKKTTSTTTTTKPKEEKKVTKKTTTSTNKSGNSKSAPSTASASSKKKAAPKKVTKTPSPAAKATKAKPAAKKNDKGVTYREMVLNGVISMNNGKGASRTALKKYIKDKYPTNVEKVVNFDYLVNTAIKKGVESGELSQPSGPSGMVKILKKGRESVKTH
ncbi:Histone H1 [Nakaseomyces bracarensis]|uniref:Histone H1 n=1 Tax=Nakaseomyces bracarensis TaxID=273131 RepID=A0ABR4NU15_9SACH